METNVISRKDFLKKIAYGSLGILAFMKLGSVPAFAAGPQEQEDTVVQSEFAPSDHSKVWINTGSGSNGYGVNGTSVPNGAMCYWNEAGQGWKPSTATWG